MTRIPTVFYNKSHTCKVSASQVSVIVVTVYLPSGPRLTRAYVAHDIRHDLREWQQHSLLLISKLLSQRENVSPFTLLVDNLEQSGKPVLKEYIRRATVSLRMFLSSGFRTDRLGRQRRPKSFSFLSRL